MILVSVGSEQYPFDRLIEAIDRSVDRFDGEAVLVQLGHCRYRPERCEWVEMLPFSDLVARIREARVVVTHAGIGMLLLCLQAGKTPIVLPRLNRYGEHVDDHQVEFAERLAALGRIVLAPDAEAVPDLVLAQAGQREDAEPAPADSVLTLSEAITGVIHASAHRRAAR